MRQTERRALMSPVSLTKLLLDIARESGILVRSKLSPNCPWQRFRHQLLNVCVKPFGLRQNTETACLKACGNVQYELPKPLLLILGHVLRLGVQVQGVGQLGTNCVLTPDFPMIDGDCQKRADTGYPPCRPTS